MIRPKAERFRPPHQAAERWSWGAEGRAALLVGLKFYRILGRCVRTYAGEIDLDARSQGCLSFRLVEVRAHPDWTKAAEALGKGQQARSAHAAALYLASHPDLPHHGLRFDVVLVVPGRLPRHIKDAWRPKDGRG